MKTYTITDIRALKPCYDPIRYVSEDWVGTVVDILRLDVVPALDRLWVATKFLDDRTNRLFAVWCAREALKLIAEPDPRSVAACGIVEAFANGNATNEEMAAAWDAAWDAASAAAWSAASAAAWDAASAAAWDAASAAAWSAASAAAWDAASAAASAAAWSAASAADRAAARDAASAAARDAARAKQIEHLIEMIEEPEK